MLPCSYDYSGYGASTGKVRIGLDSFSPTSTSLFVIVYTMKYEIKKQDY